MRTFSTTATALPPATLRAVGKAWDEVSVSFDRFCLAAGIEALGTMMERDAEDVCGRRHVRRNPESRLDSRFGISSHARAGWSVRVPTPAGVRVWLTDS
jgi:hypothetical protein